jgi:hypothetical protein
MKFFMFGRIKPLNVARESLEQARLDLLQARYYEEHYAATAMMLEQRIARLEGYVGEAKGEVRRVAW